MKNNMEVVLARAREILISVEAIPYCYCVSRCTQRAWLCGKGPDTGQSFEHRRQWVLDRLRELVGVPRILITNNCSLTPIAGKEPLSSRRMPGSRMLDDSVIPGLFTSLTLRADSQSFNTLRAFVRHAPERRKS